MTKPKSRFPSSSFSPYLHALLREGSEREIPVKCDNAKEAIYLRHRLNTLRSVLRKEDFPQWDEYCRAGCYIDPKNPTVLVVKPRDSVFEKKIEDAGVQLVPGGNTPPMDTKSAPSASPSDPAEDFLASLRRGPKLNDL